MNTSCARQQHPAYQRQSDLPKLIPATAGMLAVGTAASRQLILNLIEAELRKERLRASISGRIYRLERHFMLTQALKVELRLCGQQPTSRQRRIQRKKRCLLFKDSVFKNFNQQT